jgi:Toxin SymE, type I toxin-antitoxin system
MYKTETNIFMAAERKMTIQPRMSPRVYQNKMIPEITLKGIWLEAVGFKAGSKVVIEVRENELIIKPLEL